MFASYDMNPMAIHQMQQERLSADIERVDRSTGLPFPAGGVIVAVLVALAILL